MRESERSNQAALACPACGWHWTAIATPSAPYIGLQAVRHQCPNVRCSERHWVIVYRLRLLPRLRLEVVDTVRIHGTTPAHLRECLRKVPALDGDTLEFIVAAASLTPERV